jgi:hypothetical protein
MPPGDDIAEISIFHNSPTNIFAFDPRKLSIACQKNATHGLTAGKI